ncbi:hypothetical protein ACFSQW_07000 [Sphingobacterium tabacisoli]|uniref:Uncharacterized protein n=1 Tax=Sphingobacterium tabacisoli TaxID=2044855 RepID=A0ABW5KYW1_9SPHI
MIIILLGFLAYVQSNRTGRIFLFQDAVDLRLSVCYATDNEDSDSGSAMVKLRLELLFLSPQYKGICVEEIGFLRRKEVRLRQFNRLFFTGASTEARTRELFIVVDATRLAEIRLNGLELHIGGYLLSPELSKHAIYQKFIVFERPAILDNEEEKYLA